MVWIFCPEMTLVQFPEIGFFVQNTRKGVKSVIQNFNSAVIMLPISLDMIGWKSYPVRTNMKTPLQVALSKFFDKKMNRNKFVAADVI